MTSMNERQMIYLYMYGTTNQLETVKRLANLALEQDNPVKQKDLIGLIHWVLDYQEYSYYVVFFEEFCMGIDEAKADGEISTIDAIKLQEEYYGEAD